MAGIPIRHCHPATGKQGSCGGSPDLLVQAPPPAASFMATVRKVANAGPSDAPGALFGMFGAVFVVAHEGDCPAVLDTWSEELGFC